MPADPQRNRELALIHIAKSDLALSEESYRDILRRVVNAESSATLDARGREIVLAEFKRLGWVYRKKQPKRAGSRRRAETPIAGKARALWLSLYQLGAIDDPSEAALAQFARRQTGVDDMAWITPHEGDALIEALKSRCEREGYNATTAALKKALQPHMRRDHDAAARGYNAMLILAQWDRLIAMGVMYSGVHASLTTWLRKQGMMPDYGHPAYLGIPQQRQAIDKLGRWIRSEKQKRVRASAESADSNAGTGA